MSEDAYKRAFERERAARKAAEQIVERKTRELYEVNESLKALNSELEQRIAERTAELEQALQAAEASDEAKSHFLSMVSHEMRTPLNAILGLAELVSVDALPDSERGYIHNIRFGATQLLSLVNDILDMSSIESGRVVFETVAVSLYTIASDIHQMFAHRAAEKGIGWDVQLAEDIPDALFGDQRKLNQVLLNLCENALKFTLEGEVRLSVTLVGLDPEQRTARVRFEVQDTGIGISAQNQLRVFQFFEQAHKGIRREYGGTGLGLAISKQLVELQGGTIGCESESGLGSLFWFELPLRLRAGEERPAANAQDEPVASAKKNLEGLRLLLVEDSPTNRLVVREMAKKLALLVTEAEDGAEALSLLALSRVDFILTDLHMPRVDGIELVRQVRAMEADGAPRVPIICLTADTQAELQEAILAAGADGFIMKPVQLRQLQDALLQFVDCDNEPQGSPMTDQK